MMTVWAGDEIPDYLRDLAPEKDRELSYAITHLCRERDMPEEFFEDAKHPKLVGECLASTLYFTATHLESFKVGEYTTVYFIY